MRREYNKWTVWIGFMVLFFLFMNSLTKANTPSNMIRGLYTDAKSLFAFRGGAGCERMDEGNMNIQNVSTYLDGCLSCNAEVNENVPMLVWVNDTAMPLSRCTSRYIFNYRMTCASVKRDIPGTTSNANYSVSDGLLSSMNIITGVCAITSTNIDHNQWARPLRQPIITTKRPGFYVFNNF